MSNQPYPGRLGITARLRTGFALLLLAILGITAFAAMRLGKVDAAGAAILWGVGIAVFVAGTLLAYRIVAGITAPLRQSVAIADRLASGDLGEPFEANGLGELGALQRSLQEMSERMFQIVSKVRTGTTTIAATSGMIGTDNAALSSRTESQASSLEETASSMEELTSTVKQNADNARQAHQLVSTATSAAVKGGRVVGDVVVTMGSIKDSSRKIVDIISVIDGIAFQTNILALNAAVEAARAGEQGRGFAVVAAEVRSLAQRSAAAAKEIKTLIVDSVGEVDAGGQLVDEAGRAMSEIVTSVKRVEDIMSEIAAASAQQSTGIEEINRAIMQIDGMTQKNAELVEEASHTAASLQDQAVTLAQAVSIFNLGAREFGTAEEAAAMVQSGIDFMQANSRTALIDDVNKMDKGLFIDRDLYLSIYSMAGKCIAHGTNHRLVGVEASTFKDLDGKFFIKDILAGANSQGSGRVEYKWSHPVTQEIMIKQAYFEKAGDLILACGSWRR